MEQYELLWRYQQVDVEVDRFEREMRQDPDRQKLLKHRDFLVEQQNVVKKIETEVSMMTDRMEAIADDVRRLQETLGELLTQVEKIEAEDADAVANLTAGVQRLMNTITRYEGELGKMRKDADARDKQQYDVRVRAAKVKAEFDQIKSAYDLRYKAQSEELEKLKARASDAAKGIPAEMMEKYNTIKRHSMPPMCKMNEERCGGCNMSLPSAILHQIRAGSVAVECENCGRIILVREGA